MEVLAWRVEGYGRVATYEGKPEWAYVDEAYKVKELVDKAALLEIAPNDQSERLRIMEELFELQDKEIALLKSRLESFVELVESIVEVTTVVSHSHLENRSKIVLINESCKGLLKPSEI